MERRCARPRSRRRTMRRTNLPYVAISVISACAMLAMALSWSGSAVAQTSDGLAVAVPQAEGAPAESIQVHGHWTIDVAEPDGSAVSHTEFENALTSQGTALL